MADIRWSEIAIYLGFGFLLVWIGVLFLFGMNKQAPTTPQFSWRSVAIMGVIALPLLLLVPLLWRDQHGVWAAIMTLPAWLALHGVVHGLKLYFAGR